MRCAALWLQNSLPYYVFSILSSLTYPWLCWLETAWLWAVMLRRALALFVHLHTFWCCYIPPRNSCFLFWFRYLLSSSAIYAVPNTGGQEVQPWRWRNSSGLVLHVSQWHQIHIGPCRATVLFHYTSLLYVILIVI